MHQHGYGLIIGSVAVEDVMSKFILLSMAAVTAAFANPVLASNLENGVGTTVAPAPTPTASPKQEQRYCVIDDITGSRLPVKTCLTRKEWLARGFDPLNP